MKKIIQKIASALACGILLLSTSGCVLAGSSMPVAVASIEKTGSNGLVDIYTITYTDGTKSTFEITNGKDGENGKNANGDPISIRSIQKTSSNGLVDIYTITYTDGSKTTFEVTNGKNGENGENGTDVTAEDLYQTYISYYGNGLTYAEFLSLYLSAEDTAWHTTANECLQSAGKIYCQFTEWNTDTPATNDTVEKIYTGACVVYQIAEEYTYFLTNYHVVYSKNAAKSTMSDVVYCYLYGSEGRPVKTTDKTGKTVYEFDEYAIACEYVGGSVEYDLAIVRAKTSEVKAINQNVKPITFADGYYVGERAIAIGNPRGDGISVTQGIVCVDSENISLDIDGTSRTYRSVRIDTALYQGNSGGGLFNEKGELIGITNAGDGTDQNVNYAVPVSIVKGVAQNVMLHGDGYVYRIKLGVTVMGKNSKYTYDETVGYGSICEEVYLHEVATGSIAESLGLQAGDILKGFIVGDKTYPIERVFHIGDLLPYLTAGVSFKIVYERNGEKTTPAYTVKTTDLYKLS